MWAGQPECCRDVECVPRNIGVVLKTWAEAMCRNGCHRITEHTANGTVARQVFDVRTGSPNAVWPV